MPKTRCGMPIAGIDCNRQTNNYKFHHSKPSGKIIITGEKHRRVKSISGFIQQAGAF
jgi:hypothetical protein